MRTSQYINILAYIVLILGFSGCAKKTTVVLLPDPDGKVGHITVENQAGSVDITQSGESTVIEDKTTPPAVPKVISTETIDADYTKVLSTLPLLPEHFIVYFAIEKTQMIKESIATLPAIFNSIDRRKSANISVVGHTDTSGKNEYNMMLSRGRAIAVSNILIQQGVLDEQIEAASYGEELPLIKTGDNVFEQRNRRVEIVIR